MSGQPPMLVRERYSNPSTVCRSRHARQTIRGVSRPTHCRQTAFWQTAQIPTAGERSWTKQFTCHCPFDERPVHHHIGRPPAANLCSPPPLLCSIKLRWTRYRWVLLVVGCALGAIIARTIVTSALHL